MTVSVFLGGFGFGNLGDEACLGTAYRLYRSDTNCVFTFDQVITSKVGPFELYFRRLRDLLDAVPKIDRVIIAGGGVGFMPSFKDNLDWAMHCQSRGADVIIHNIGIGKIGGQWTSEFPALLEVLRSAKEFSVRDFRSKAEVESWNVGLSPEVSYYPERAFPIDPKLQPLLPTGRDFVGISMNNRPQLWSVMADNRASIAQLLGAYADCAILPIVSTIHGLDQAEHDNQGFLRFVDMFGLGDRVVVPEICDRDFWRDNIGPGDVKYLISRCKFLISARKHNIIHAIGAGVPFVGVFEFDNDSIARVYQTLYPDLPANSSLFPIYPC